MQELCDEIGGEGFAEFLLDLVDGIVSSEIAQGLGFSGGELMVMVVIWGVEDELVGVSLLAEFPVSCYIGTNPVVIHSLLVPDKR